MKRTPRYKNRKPDYKTVYKNWQEISRHIERIVREVSKLIPAENRRTSNGNCAILKHTDVSGNKSRGSSRRAAARREEVNLETRARRVEKAIEEAMLDDGKQEINEDRRNTADGMLKRSSSSSSSDTSSGSANTTINKLLQDALLDTDNHIDDPADLDIYVSEETINIDPTSPAVL